MARPDTPSDEVAEPHSMRWTISRVLVVLAVLVIVGFWAAIFAGVFRADNPDDLVANFDGGSPAAVEMEAFVDRTHARCQALRADLGELPNAEAIPGAEERADVLDRANALVAGMVDDIEADAPTGGDPGTSMRGWIEDWRTYVANREDYARRLRADPGARLLLDERFGDSVDRTIEVFADVNDMPDCATPGDVG